MRDYRNKYCGKWVITIESTSYNYATQSGVPDVYNSTITYENARVTYYKSTDDTIRFEYNSSGLNPKAFERPLQENGIIGGCGTEGAFTSEDEFYMEVFENGICNSYSAGGYTIARITGRRK